MAILWRVSPRQGRIGLVGRVSNSLPGGGFASTGDAGFNVNFDEFFGLVGTDTSAQGQTVAIQANVTVDGPVTVAQGGQTIDASGYPFGNGIVNTFQGQTVSATSNITVDAPTTTAQGQTVNASSNVTANGPVTTAQGQTIDASGAMHWDSTVATAQGQTIDSSATVGGATDGPVTTAQGSQTIDAAGVVKTVTTVQTAQGKRVEALWRDSPRKQRISLVAQLAQTKNSAALPGVALEAFFQRGYVAGQTVDVVGDVHPFARTAQGGQTVDAIGFITGAHTYQGSQTVDAVATPTSDSSVRTAQGQTADVVVYWDIDSTVATRQGQSVALTVPAVIVTSQGQTVDAVGSVPLVATVATAQGDQTVDGALSGEFEQTVDLSGINSLAFGTASLHSNKLQMHGFDASAFGTLSIGNATIKVKGASFMAFGRAKIQNGTNYIKPLGQSWTKFGVPKLHSDALGMRGFDTSKFGTATISNYIRDVFPLPFDSLVFGTNTISNYERTIPLTGFDSSEFGTAKVHSNKIPMSVGDSMKFGRATISNFIRYIDFTDQGIDSSAFGNDTIYNFLTYVQLKGFDSAVVPAPLQIAYRIRTIHLQGQSFARYGQDTISNFLQYVNLNGSDFSVVWDDFGPVNPLTGFGARVWLARARPPMQGFDSASVGTPALVQLAGPIGHTPC
jgi:hypothetical protein